MRSLRDMENPYQYAPEVSIVSTDTHGGRTLSEPGIEISTPSNDLAHSRRREPSATEVPGWQWDALRPL